MGFFGPVHISVHIDPFLPGAYSVVGDDDFRHSFLVDFSAFRCDENGGVATALVNEDAVRMLDGDMEVRGIQGAGDI